MSNIKLLAFPVGPWWLRINALSKHEAVFPSQGPTHHERWLHVEVSTARGLLPMTQQVSTSIEADCQAVILQGHDFGPMAPHFCNPLDNVMLPLTLIGSSCTWPVTATRRHFHGKPVCVFLHFIIPFVHCHARKGADQKKSKAEAKNTSPKPKQAENPYESAIQTETAESFLRDLPSQMPGLGFAMVPTGPQTTMLPLGFWDFVAGWARVFVNMVFDSAWKQLKIKGRGAKPLQDNAARRIGAAEGAYARVIGERMLEETVKGLVKGFYSSAELNLPCNLVKLDVKSGKLVIWTKEVGDIGWKPADLGINYRGWNAIINVPPPDQSDANQARTSMLDQLIDGAPHAD